MKYEYINTNIRNASLNSAMHRECEKLEEKRDRVVVCRTFPALSVRIEEKVYCRLEVVALVLRISQCEARTGFAFVVVDDPHHLATSTVTQSPRSGSRFVLVFLLCRS